MQITVTTEEGTIFPLEVSLELTLLDLKAILEIELAMSPSQMVLFHNMNPMTVEDRSLTEYNVEDGDVIMLTSSFDAEDETQQQQTPMQTAQPPTGVGVPLPPTEVGAALPDINWGQIQLPGGPLQHGSVNPAPPPRQQQVDPNDPEVIRRHFLSHPGELEMLRQQNPPLAQALESGDAEFFRQVLHRHTQAVREVERQRIRMLSADPLDPQNQSRIAQDIQQKNIEENMQAAIEYTPESFTNITMLYLPIKVNGVTVKALVDSGAAGTIMSDKCAERCGVMRLVDRRFAGMAIGIGTQRIIGKVHLGTIQIGKDFLTSSFKVLEDQTEDMLLGLDMLRRHQCCIDLKKNVLRVGTTGNETPFLTEADLKDKEETRRKQAQRILEGEDAEMAQAIATSEHSVSSTQSSQSSSNLPGPSSQSVPPSASGGGGGVSVSESAIREIVSAGFSREEAVAELRRTDGNVQLALTALLAKTISLPDLN